MGYIGRDNRVSTFTKQSITADGGTSFTLNQGVGDSSSVMVSIGGVVQQPDVAYTAAGTSLTFTSAPTNAYPIWVIYLGKELTVASETNFDNVASQTGVGDGTTTPLTLSNSVSSVQSIIVTLNGIAQVPTTDFTVSGTTLTFTTAPSSAMAILIYYIDLSLAENVVSDETVMLSSLASTGTWPAWDGSALTGMVDAAQITKLHDDIALLHFLRSIDSSSAISNMIEGWSDTFPNTTSVVDGSLSVPLTKFTTGDSLSRGGVPTGLSDGPSGTISCWVKFDAGSDGSNMFILTNTTSHFRLFRDAANKFYVQAHDASNNPLWSAASTNAFTVSSGLMHIMLSWNLVGGSPSTHLYVNGSSQAWTHNTNPTAGTIDYTDTNMGFGMDNLFYRGDLGQFYFDPNYIDLSVQANREKFVSGTGASVKPVDFGTDGSTPTGTQPIIYLNNPFGTFQNNLGSGGNFTENGVLEDGGYVSDKVYSSTNFSPSYELLEHHSRVLASSVNKLSNGSSQNIMVGQCLTLSDTSINKVVFRLRGDSSPTGDVTAIITPASGTVGSTAVGTNEIIAISEKLDASTIGSYANYEFIFPNSVKLTAGDYFIGLHFPYGDNNSLIAVGTDDVNYASASHMNLAINRNSGGWQSVQSGNATTIFTLYGQKNLTLTTKGSDSLTATSPATAPTKGYFQALLSERPASGTSIWSDVLDQDGNGSNDNSYRQIVLASDITTNGSKIRVTIPAGASEALLIDNVAIVERSGFTSNGVTTPTEILFGGSSGVFVPKSSNTTSDWTDFEIDQTKDYLLVVDVATGNGNDTIRLTQTGGNGYYYLTGNTYNTASFAASGFAAGKTIGFNKLEVAVNPTINTDIIGEISRDGGTTYSPAVLSRVTDVVAGSSDRIVQGDVSFTGDPSGTNMVGRIRTVNNNKVTVKAMGINWD